jgi:glycosyltransferase involved in cell wall biosynthesis
MTQVAPGKNKRSMVARLLDKAPEILFELAEIAYNIPAAWQLWRRRRQFRYDVMYERYAIFACAAAIVSRLTKVPLIIEVNYTSLSPLVRQRSRLLKPIGKRMDRWIFRSAAGLAAVSSYLRDELIHEFGVEPERIAVVPNAADPDKFVPSSTERAPVPFTIGFVGSFFPWHGVDMLLHAIAKLREADVFVRAILIGDGPQRGFIEALANELEIGDRVEFRGQIGHADLPRHIREFDVGVMPDSNVYGSPMKVFEYMALGKPVIAPDYGPLRDAYRDEVHGLIFPRKDIAALAACFKRLASDPALVTKMGVAAREHVVNERNWMNNTVISLNLLPFAGEH